MLLGKKKLAARHPLFTKNLPRGKILTIKQFNWEGSLKAHAQKKYQRGFSFIEALFALVILSFGFVGILSLYSMMDTNTGNDEMKLIASKLASEKVEQILASKASVGYENISTGTSSEQISYDSLSFQRQTSVNFVIGSDLKTISGSDTGFKRIDVTLNWNNGSSQSVSVMSLISNH